MHRIVHLDLKGAPLKVSYLEQVLRVIKIWGATGIILEWEDTFPYMAELVDIGSQSNSGGDNMYSLAEVQHILKIIKDIGLVPIQLVQTIGHMEFALKHPAFRELREIDRSPAVLCPTKEKSQLLVRAMIDQAMDIQPDATYLHIGADEVWHSAVCPDCRVKAENNKHKAASLYLEHIRNLALYIKEKRPELIVLMWDDMLREIPFETLSEYGLTNLVQPVVWHYASNECYTQHQKLFTTYGQLFPEIWAASAFKGANGSCQVLSTVRRYVTNHEGWVDTIKESKDLVRFTGIILTGWSRYDHYATLCELLPVSLPSLAACLKVLTDAHELPRDHTTKDILPSPEWPGEELARSIHSFVIIRERGRSLLNSDLVTTWLNPWQIERNFTVPVHVEGIAVAGQHILSELVMIQAAMSSQLLEITGERSTEEWLRTYVAPLIRQLTELCAVSVRRSTCDASVRPEI